MLSTTLNGYCSIHIDLAPTLKGLGYYVGCVCGFGGSMGRGFQATGYSLGMALFIYKVFLPQSNYTTTFKDLPAYKMSKHQ